MLVLLMMMLVSKMMFCQSVLVAGRFSDSDNDSIKIDKSNNETNKNLSESTKNVCITLLETLQK